MSSNLYNAIGNSVEASVSGHGLNATAGTGESPAAQISRTGAVSGLRTDPFLQAASLHCGGAFVPIPSGAFGSRSFNVSSGCNGSSIIRGTK